MKEFVCLVVFILLATIFAIAMIVCGFICQYKKTNSVKNTTYECGLQCFSDAKLQFDIKYFNYAVLFLIFDIETVFLYPFAYSINKLGIFAIIEAFVFVSLLLFSLLFAINKKFLRWA